MMTYFKNRESVAAFVSDIVLNSTTDLPWTMIIGQDKSGDFYAHIATDIVSEDSAEKPYRLCMTISTPTTPDG